MYSLHLYMNSIQLQYVHVYARFELAKQNKDSPRDAMAGHYFSDG